MIIGLSCFTLTIDNNHEDRKVFVFYKCWPLYNTMMKKFSFTIFHQATFLSKKSHNDGGAAIFGDLTSIFLLNR